MQAVQQALRRALRPLRGPLYWTERRLYGANVFALRGLTLPNFLGLGSGQSGTTWLYENLARHPGVCMSESKETQYFTLNFHLWPLSHYASLFADAGSRVRGEITPGYNVLRLDRIRYIYSILPDARLILMVRNPVERTWSAARRHCSQWAGILGKRFDELADDVFYDYFRTEWLPFFNPPRRAYHWEPGLLQCHYSDQIDRWLSIYPEKQLFVGFFDEIKSDPRGLLAKVCLHIGARTDIDWDALPLAKVVNQNPAHPIPQRFRDFLNELYAPEISRLEKRFGAPVTAWRQEGVAPRERTYARENVCSESVPAATANANVMRANNAPNSRQ